VLKAILVGLLAAVVSVLLPSDMVVLVAVAVTLTSWVVLVPRLGVSLLVVMLILQGLMIAVLTPVNPELAAVAKLLDEIALLAAGVRIIWLLIRGHWELLSGRWLIFLGLFILAGLLSSVLHWGGVGPLLLGLALALKFPSFLIVVRSVPWDSRDGDRLLLALRVMVPVLLLTGALGLLFPDFQRLLLAASELNQDFSRGGHQPFVVPFVHPGLFGWMMAVGTLAWFVRWSQHRSVTAGVGFLGGLGGALLSLRRRPLIGIPLAIFSGLLGLSFRQRALIMTLLLIGALSLGTLARNAAENAARNAIAEYYTPDAQSTAARAALVAGSLILAQQSFPLGAGLGRYGGYASQKYYSPVYEQLGLSNLYGFSEQSPYYISDTYWPHILGETGLIGAVAMFLTLGALWLRMRSVRRESGDPVLARLAFFGSLVLAEGLVESVAGPVFEVSLQALVIALPIGMCLALGQASVAGHGDLDRGPGQGKAGDDRHGGQHDEASIGTAPPAGDLGG
jgi:hypothetical protein